MAFQEAKPATIVGDDHFPGAFGEVCPGPGGLVKDIAGFKGPSERLDVGFWPLIKREMLQPSHGFSSFFSGFLGLGVGAGLRRFLRLSLNASRFSPTNRL